VREFVKLEKQLWQANGLDKKPIVGIEDAAELFAVFEVQISSLPAI
jgi:hypothetical protein